jgi:hypothetical protein
MRIKITLKIVFLFMLLAFLMPTSYGQKKKSTSSSGKNFGVGVKLGDPLGLSLKKYNGNKAFELIIGRSYYYGGADYYGYYYKHDKRFKNGYVYGGYDTRSTPIAIQLHYLIHKDISSVDGLQWYYGVGGQLRYATFKYRYWDVNTSYNVQYARVTDFGIGPDGVLGLEYTFNDVPISLALDLDLYMEIIDRPFMFLLQGGLGVRYNF